MIHRFLAIAAIVLFAFIATEAQAATAISYSEPENTYGWCSGYSTSEAPGCAADWCEQSGGTDCRLAVICDSGWSAMALADGNDASGFGASCDMGSVYNARFAALATCIVASRTLCWTDGAFDGGGNQRSQDDNRTFDMTWYVQGLLKAAGEDPGSTDGIMGNRTRAAIRSFQAEIGIEQDGEVTDELFHLLLMRAGGVGFVVSGMEELVAEFTSDELSRVFAASASPLGSRTLTEELATRSVSVQRILLAAFLSNHDYDCPPPAASVAVDVAAGKWDITCSNDDRYSLVLADDDWSGTVFDENPLEFVPLSEQPELLNDQPATGPGPASPTLRPGPVRGGG